MPHPRAFIIHGYLSNPAEAWLPWLRAELERRGCTVALPAMPNPDRPVISEWIAFIAGLVGEPDNRTVMVGHSIGCQAVIRYLETLGSAGKCVAKTVLVAGSFPPGFTAGEADAKTGGNQVLQPWFTTPVDAAEVKRAAGKCTVILSDDDPDTDVSKAAASFRLTLDPKIIIETGKGHYNEDTTVTELPAALEAVIS
jgi:predicted alpha/beta hydrolase family esterase